MLLKENQRQNDPFPAGLHHAVCYAIYDLGHQWSETYQKWSPKMVFIYEAPDERTKIIRDGKELDLPRAISVKFTQTLTPKGKLRPFLEAWRGRPFTPEELAGFDPKKVLGANAQIQVNHRAGEGKHAGKVHADIVAALPLSKSQTRLTAENPLSYFSFSEVPEGDLPVFPEHMPEWVQNVIRESKEWQDRSHAQQAPTVPPPPADTKDEAEPEENVPF